MSWARIDDTFAWHPKVMQAGNAAVGAWLRCLVHCCASRTDGFVAAQVAKAIGSPKEIAAITAAGLWRRVKAGDSITVTGRRDTARRRLPDVTVIAPAAGYLIADFLHYHRARTETTDPSEDDSTAPCAQHRAHSTVQAKRVHRPVPSHPIPSSTTSLPPSPSPPQPSPSGPGLTQPGAAPAAPEGGREGGVAPQEPSDGEGCPLPQEDLETMEDLLTLRGWHARQDPTKRWHIVQALARDGLTVETTLALCEAADAQAEDPGGLLGAWLDRGSWRDVLASGEASSKASKAKRRNGTPTATSDLLAGIYDPRRTA